MQSRFAFFVMHLTIPFAFPQIWMAELILAQRWLLRWVRTREWGRAQSYLKVTPNYNWMQNVFSMLWNMWIACLQIFLSFPGLIQVFQHSSVRKKELLFFAWGVEKSLERWEKQPEVFVGPKGGILAKANNLSSFVFLSLLRSDVIFSQRAHLAVHRHAGSSMWIFLYTPEV